MIIPFSQRHIKLIESKKFVLSLSERQKRKLIYVIEANNEYFDEVTETNFNYTETTLEKSVLNFKRAHGIDKLGNKSHGNASNQEILDYAFSAKEIEILDIIEIFYSNSSSAEIKSAIETELNQILKTENLHIRFLDGEFFRIDSDFAESEILFRTNNLLKLNNFEAAHINFIEAKERLSSGDFSGSIVKANNALESYLKKLLDEKYENQGKLKKSLIKSGIIPDYFQGFIDSFEGIVQSAFTMANKSARHGGKEIVSEINRIDEPLAAFYLNLVGSIIIFIVGKQSNKNLVLNNEEFEEKGNNLSEIMDNENKLPF